VRLVVDVEPLPAALAAKLDRAPDELCTESTPLHVRVDGGIEQEGMTAAVGRDVDVADEAPVLIGAEVDEADLPFGKRTLPGFAPGRRPELAERRAGRIGIDLDVEAQSFLRNMTLASPSA
jgi:hypothetical protein